MSHLEGAGQESNEGLNLSSNAGKNVRIALLYHLGIDPDNDLTEWEHVEKARESEVANVIGGGVVKSSTHADGSVDIRYECDVPELEGGYPDIEPGKYIDHLHIDKNGVTRERYSVIGKDGKEQLRTAPFHYWFTQDICSLEATGDSYAY